jgi:CRISPR-associated protein Cmr3
MFRYLITIEPLGLMYGSAGAFLSPENLVGRSGTKFPPDAATLSGLFFSANKERKFETHTELVKNLYIAGPFWSKTDTNDAFYVPLPRHKVIAKDRHDEWFLKARKWHLKSQEADPDVEPDQKEDSEYRWVKIDRWNDTPEEIYADRNHSQDASVAKKCWEYVSVLHPQMKQDFRNVLEKDGLFLENAVQMREETHLVYLSTYPLESGWYQFGGEGHFVEVNTIKLVDDSPILTLLKQPIRRSFALITPGVWGSHNLSYRYPKQQGFASDNQKIAMLTDRPIPYRYRIGHGAEKPEPFRTRKPGRLSRGRYAIPAGSVYVLREPLNKPWWNFPTDWFPEKGLLKKFGCGLCLPIKIAGVED